MSISVSSGHHTFKASVLKLMGASHCLVHKWQVKLGLPELYMLISFGSHGSMPMAQNKSHNQREGNKWLQFATDISHCWTLTLHGKGTRHSLLLHQRLQLYQSQATWLPEYILELDDKTMVGMVAVLATCQVYQDKCIQCSECLLHSWCHNSISCPKAPRTQSYTTSLQAEWHSLTCHQLHQYTANAPDVCFKAPA